MQEMSLYYLQRHFLIEGDPGSGKTSATYNTLYKYVRINHPELLDDVWFVSNSEENALDNTAKMQDQKM